MDEPTTDHPGPDYLRRAKATMVDIGNPEVVQKGQLYALIAIAESFTGQQIPGGDQLLRATPAHMLRTDDILADGSIVVSVDGDFDEPDVTYVTVVQLERTYKLAMLRTTPVGLKT